MLAARTLPALFADDRPAAAPFMALAGNVERRRHRRHDLEALELPLERWDALRRTGEPIGRIIELSAGGVRFKSAARDLHPQSHVRIKLTLPNYAGISPFVDLADGMRPKCDWTGWLVITRVAPRFDGLRDVSGKLADMDDTDRGMLSLYLSTQPLAD